MQMRPCNRCGCGWITALPIQGRTAKATPPLEPLAVVGRAAVNSIRSDVFRMACCASGNAL
eukprot:1503357-Amphidinium_carterae.1